jgi:sigma-B regulation protein RsbU (phosphoserine phosphatase)
LGIQEDLIYQQDSIALGAGDALFYYTDGLTEAFDIDRNQFTDERLIDYLLTNRDRSAHGTCQRF